MAKKKPQESEQSAAELEGKVQTHDQTDGVNDPKLDIPPAPSTGVKEVEQPKAAINTKTAAEVVSNAQSSIGSGMLRSGALVFGGSAGTIKDDVSATTREAIPYRSGSRSGRRVDPITRKLDYLDAEVIKTKVFESKPLSETDAKQGFPGNYFNQHAITQKANGGVPAEPLYERSVDEIDIDMIYYPDGQRVKRTGQGDMSIHSWSEANNAYEAQPRSFTVGNFLPRALIVTFDANGNIVGFQLDETNCSVNNNSELVARVASDAHIREMNQRELDRNVMISTAGNESDPSWSPLGDVIIDATDQNRMLAFLEGLAGDNVLVSRHKLRTALSYQLNKAAKDGSRVTGPMAEMLNGNVALAGYGADGAVNEANGRAYALTTPAVFKAGGAGLWLAINDSLPKYTTKGKLLTLPLSFKSALGIVDSNADPLRVHKLLVDELTHNELFSTIDGPYDPLKAVVVTDKTGLMNPISLMTGCTFNAQTHQLDSVVYVMHYENLRNRYNIRIRNYFMEAIFRWLDERGLRFYAALGQNDQGSTNRTVRIPIVSSTTSLSLWDLIVTSATPYMIEARLVGMTELLKYEKNHGYPYTGLVPFKEVKDASFDNFSLTDVDSPISTAIAKPVAAIKVMFPEVFWPINKRAGEGWNTGHNGVGAWVVLPHYFNQAQFKYTDTNRARRNLSLDPDFYASMSYPSTRSGSMLSFLDTVYGMSEEDYRLSLDRMVVYPGYDEYGSKSFRNASAGAAQKNDAYTYKYGMSGDGIPVIPYFAYAASADNVGEALQVVDILSTPRELGLFQVAPAGVLSPILTGANVLNTVALTSSYLGLSGPGFRAKVYHAEGTTQVHAILQAGSTNFDNSASIRYVWCAVYATPYSVANQATGIAFSAQNARNLKPFVDGSYAVGYGQYNAQNGIFAGTETQIAAGDDIGAYGFIDTAHPYLWTRLQRLPFVINPFDCNMADITNGTQSDINSNDIFDLMYIFGFEGFRTSDYSELVYERSKLRIAQGMNYVADPFVDKSMLLK